MNDVVDKIIDNEYIEKFKKIEALVDTLNNICNFLLDTSKKIPEVEVRGKFYNEMIKKMSIYLRVIKINIIKLKNIPNYGTIFNSVAKILLSSDEINSGDKPTPKAISIIKNDEYYNAVAIIYDECYYFVYENRVNWSEETKKHAMVIYEELLNIQNLINII